MELHHPARLIPELILARALSQQKMFSLVYNQQHILCDIPGGALQKGI